MSKTIKVVSVLLISISLMVISSLVAYAVPVDSTPHEVKQADGTTITIIGHGDEFFSWVEDENGNVIAYDAASKNWCYAYISGDEILPNQQSVVGVAIQPRSGGMRIQSDALKPLLDKVDYSIYDIVIETDAQLQSQLDAEIMDFSSIYTAHEGILLPILIEYNDVNITQTMQYWHDKYFNMGETSVNKFYSDMSSGSFTFKPVDFTSDNGVITSGLPSGVTSVELSNGVAKVKLNKNHPSNNGGGHQPPGNSTFDDVNLAYSAIKNYIDFDLIPKGISGYIVPEDFAVSAIIAGWSSSTYINDARVQRVGGLARTFRTGGRVFTVPANGDAVVGNDTYLSVATQAELYYSDGDLVDGIITGTVSPLGIGTIVHEVGHLLGLPDLYDASGADSAGIGVYCVMSSGSWGQTLSDWYPGLTPVAFSAWSKIRLGYITPTVIDQSESSSTFDMKSFNPADFTEYDVLKVTNANLGSNQYFLVENRQNSSWDLGFWYNPPVYDAGGGILIYQIDESVVDNYGRISNRNWHHRGVDIVGAGQNGANSSLFYTSDHATRNTLSNFTNPNNSFYQPVVGAYEHTSPASNCHPRDIPSNIQIKVNSTSANTMEVEVGPVKPGDLNNDGDVNAADLSILLANFGKSGAAITNSAADINGDEDVNAADLSILLSNFGK